MSLRSLHLSDKEALAQADRQADASLKSGRSDSSGSTRFDQAPHYSQVLQIKNTFIDEYRGNRSDASSSNGGKASSDPLSNCSSRSSLGDEATQGPHDRDLRKWKDVFEADALTVWESAGAISASWSSQDASRRRPVVIKEGRATASAAGTKGREEAFPQRTPVPDGVANALSQELHDMETLQHNISQEVAQRKKKKSKRGKPGAEDGGANLAAEIGSTCSQPDKGANDNLNGPRAACMLAGLAKDKNHWALKLPSIGTIHHGTGTCTPCCRLASGGCKKGQNCTMCHHRAHLRISL